MIPAEKMDDVQLLLQSYLSVDTHADFSVSSPLLSSIRETSVAHDKMLKQQHRNQSTTCISSSHGISLFYASFDSHPHYAKNVDSLSGTRAKQ